MKVTIKVTAVKEEMTPERAEKTQKYAEGFAKSVRGQMADARKLNPRSRWGWCTVDVTATVQTEDGTVGEGRDSLGQCSYTSDLDFVLNSGYYEDMVATATAGAMAALRTAPGRAMGRLLASMA